MQTAVRVSITTRKRVNRTTCHNVSAERGTRRETGCGAEDGFRIYGSFLLMVFFWLDDDVAGYEILCISMVNDVAHKVSIELLPKILLRWNRFGAGIAFLAVQMVIEST